MNGISTTLAPGTSSLARIIRTYNTELSSSLNRISTGLRVSKPSDDVGVYFHASELNRLSEASGKTASGIQEHLSRLGTAEEALSSIQDLLDQMAEKAKEASTESSASIRAALGAEYDTLKEGITTIVNTTRFKGQLLLNGSLDSSAKTNGTDGKGVSVMVGDLIEDLYTYEIFDTRITPDANSDGANTFRGLNLNATSAKTAWGDADAAVGQAAAAASYTEITESDAGLSRLRRNQGRIATGLSVLGGARNILEVKQANYAAASSSLAGVDQALETSRYTSLQIQQQAAASFLAQSNVSFSQVIGVLTGYGGYR